MFDRIICPTERYAEHPIILSACFILCLLHWKSWPKIKTIKWLKAKSLLSPGLLTIQNHKKTKNNDPPREKKSARKTGRKNETKKITFSPLNSFFILCFPIFEFTFNPCLNIVSLSWSGFGIVVFFINRVVSLSLLEWTFYFHHRIKKIKIKEIRWWTTGGTVKMRS